MKDLMFRYCAYGLVIASDIALPEMTEPVPDTPVDVTIRRADGPLAMRGDLVVGLPYFSANAQTARLQLTGIGQFEMSAGQQITYAPEGNIDEASLRLFLLGSCLGVILFQRDFFVVHGNAVRIGNGCILCIGPSGIGKSTLAASFIGRGFEILADDVVPVDMQGHALPGFPRIKLWNDTTQNLNIPTAELQQIRPEIDKFNVPVPDSFCTQPLPVQSIYVLQTDEQHSGNPVASPVRGMDAFSRLAENTYRGEYLGAMQRQAWHLERCVQLARQAQVFTLTRPADGFDPDRLVDVILGCVGAQT